MPVELATKEHIERKREERGTHSCLDFCVLCVLSRRQPFPANWPTVEKANGQRTDSWVPAEFVLGLFRFVLGSSWVRPGLKTVQKQAENREFQSWRMFKFQCSMVTAPLPGRNFPSHWPTDEKANSQKTDSYSGPTSALLHSYCRPAPVLPWFYS
jgi:hypothetical protein